MFSNRYEKNSRGLLAFAASLLLPAAHIRHDLADTCKVQWQLDLDILNYISKDCKKASKGFDHPEQTVLSCCSAL